MANPTSLYYPLRLWQSRGYLKQCLSEFREHQGNITPKKSLDIIAPHLMAALKEQGWRPEVPGASIACFSQEMQGALAWCEWATSARHVYVIGKELTEAFCHSDCGEMHIADFIPEHAVQYMHFEWPETEAIRYGQGLSRFEGAYILYSTVSLRIVLCPRNAPEYPKLEAWRERYDLRIPAAFYGMAADEALDQALALDLKELRDTESGLSKKPLSAQARQDAQMLSQRMVEDFLAYQAAVRLIFNALAYLHAAPSDRLATWPEEAPEKLVRQVDTGSPTEKKRAQNKLWALGHVPVVRIGADFRCALRSDKGIKAHWRRGHWRRQPYGPEAKLRKLIWLQPTVVGSPTQRGRESRN